MSSPATCSPVKTSLGFTLTLQDFQSKSPVLSQAPYMKPIETLKLNVFWGPRYGLVRLSSGGLKQWRLRSVSAASAVGSTFGGTDAHKV